MTRENPYFRKCCFVIPLSLCLQTWAIIKILSACAALVVASMAFGFSLIWCESYGLLSLVILLAVLMFVLCIDIAFSILLMVAVCKKSSKYLRVSYIYDIYVVISESLVLIALSMYIFIEVAEAYYAIILVVGLLYIFLDICIILALKSEMIKLRNKKQYDFVKITSYPSEVEDIGLRHDADDSL